MADPREAVTVGPPEALRELAESLAGHDAASLIDPLRADQAARWRAGGGPRAEDYLAVFPALRGRTEDLLVLIWGEVLLRAERGEAPDPADYQRRFPDLAQALALQFELEQGLGAATLPAAATPPGGPAGRISVARVGRHGPQTGEEVRTLLRKRLLFIVVALSVTFVVYWVGFVGLLTTDPVILSAGAFGIPLSGGLAALLWSRRPLSLGQLRWIEAGLFGGLALVYTYLLHLWFPSDLLSNVSGEPLSTVIVARGVCFRWFVLLVLYGILIPNTWRRCAAFVGAMALWCVLVNAALVLRHAPEAASHFLLELVVTMGFGTALAVYGSHRIEALRRQASEARKLGPYRLTRRLGGGGMGEVWLAEHALLRRPCAVKLIRAERVGDPQALRRFEREVQATAGLSHPNTVEIYDYGTADDGTFYYAMEYLPGLTLDDLVRRHGPLPPERAVHLLRQLCGALQEAHGVGLVHRDVKPANVIVCQRGGLCDVAKLLDFGLVRAPGRGGAEQTLTQEGLIAGTPAFMSPEQARGSADVDGRSDVYGLGALAYFLLTGQPPFVRGNAVEVLAAHLTEAVEPPSRRRPDVPADLEAVVLRCLEKEPARRFRSADELEQALARCDCAGRWTPQRAFDWWRERGAEGS